MDNSIGIINKQRLLFILFFILFFLLSLINLEHVPTNWWDEGWTLNVARNWVELRHYDHLIDGQPRGLGLIAAFPVVVTRTAGTNEFVNMRENRYSFACGNSDKLTNALIQFSNNRDMACQRVVASYIKIVHLRT